MSSFFRTCLDGHRCENGSSCAQHPLEEGTYFCDCTTSTGDFAGLFCEYEAETYCQLPQETSSTWFCTNQGTCVVATNSGGAAQWKCDCPSEYEGPVSRIVIVLVWKCKIDITMIYSNIFFLLQSCILSFLFISIVNSLKEMFLRIGLDLSSTQRLYRQRLPKLKRMG
jgi:hypothetical protein